MKAFYTLSWCDLDGYNHPRTTDNVDKQLDIIDTLRRHRDSEANHRKDLYIRYARTLQLTIFFSALGLRDIVLSILSVAAFCGSFHLAFEEPMDAFHCGSLVGFVGPTILHKVP